MYRIKKSNPTFHRNLGRLQGSVLLMNAIGYSGTASSNIVNENDIAAYVLKSVNSIAGNKLEKGVDTAFGTTTELGTSKYLSIML